jgi:RNA polymerase sigma-70 factor (ECF subfamily)
MARSEEHLINAAQQGELAAYNELVLNYQGLAFSVAYGILGERDAAADATQESFLKAFRFIRSFRGGSFKAWLTRIVANTCHDQLRCLRRRPTSSLDAILDQDWNPSLTDRSRGPVQLAEDGDLTRLLQLGLRSLPDDQRTVLILSDVEGFNYQEISQATGLALGTVKSRLSRARAKMRIYLLCQPDLLPSGWVKRHAESGAQNVMAGRRAP